MKRRTMTQQWMDAVLADRAFAKEIRKAKKRGRDIYAAWDDHVAKKPHPRPTAAKKRK